MAQPTVTVLMCSNRHEVGSNKNYLICLLLLIIQNYAVYTEDCILQGRETYIGKSTKRISDIAL